MNICCNKRLIFLIYLWNPTLTQPSIYFLDLSNQAFIHPSSTIYIIESLYGGLWNLICSLFIFYGWFKTIVLYYWTFHLVKKLGHEMVFVCFMKIFLHFLLFSHTEGNLILLLISVHFFSMVCLSHVAKSTNHFLFVFIFLYCMFLLCWRDSFM